MIAMLMAAALAGEIDVWPEFRANGGIADAKLPTQWSEKENIRWKTPIPGKAWASPVIWKNQVWLANADPDGHKLSAVAVDRETGKVVFDNVLFEVSDPEFCHPTNSYGSCTPAIEEGRAYFHFGSYGTACVDTKTGVKLWERRDLPCDHFRGPASSPILFGDLLYVNFDGVDVQYVVALEKATGKTRWKKDRSTDYGNVIGDLKKGYGTPLVVEVGGRHILVSPGAVGTIAYDAKTGEEVWRVRHGGMNAACRPVAADGLIYLCVGADKNSLLAMKQDAVGDVPESAFVWRTGRNAAQRATPIVHGGLLYMINDAGVVSCLDAKTGGERYRERLRKGTFWASPILADGKLYFFSQEGLNYTLAAGPKFKVLATSELADGGNATPAVAGNALFHRTRTHLYRIEEPSK